MFTSRKYLAPSSIAEARQVLPPQTIYIGINIYTNYRYRVCAATRVNAVITPEQHNKPN